MERHTPESGPVAVPPQRPNGGRPGPEDRWTVPDLIDFEYYLDRDEQELREHPAGRTALADRDRSIYLDRIAPVVSRAKPHTAMHRRWSLRRWLEARRESDVPAARALLPGTAFARAQRWIVIAMGLLGFLGGIGAASALLSYEGQRPVNIAWFLFLLVGAQFLIIAGGVAAWVVRKSRAMDSTLQDITLLGRLIRPMFTRLGRLLQRNRLARVSREVRERALAGSGMLKANYTLYGPVSYLPVLVPAQILGVAFNVGIIVTTVSRIWFTDLAFGWGSTLDLDPTTIYHLARTIAAPWRWLFGEGAGFPTLEQVAGSRFNLKDPLSMLRAEHLHSWRWFLVLCVLTYGLLPRLALLGASLLAQRHILGRLPFSHGRTQAVYARMISPRLETGTTAGGRGPEMPIPAPIAAYGPLGQADAAQAGGTAPPETRRPMPPEMPPLPATRVLAPALAPAEKRRQLPAAPPAKPAAPEIEAKETPKKQAEAPLRDEVPAPGPSTTPQPEVEIAPPETRGKGGTEREPEPEAIGVPEPEAAPAAEAEAPPQTPKKPTAAPEAPAAEEAEAPPVSEQQPKAEPVPVVKTAPQAAPTPVAEAPAGEAGPPPSPEPETEQKVERKAEAGPESEPAPAVPTEPSLEVRQRPIPEAEPAATPEPEPVPEPAAPPEAEEKATALGVPGGIAPDACLLLIHVDVDELIEDADRPRLARMLMAHSGWRVAGAASFGSGKAMTEGVVRWVEEQDWLSPPPRLAIVMDGSQPPITENLRFLRELRAAAGPRAQILLTLVGDPADDDHLPPMRRFDYLDWHRKIDAMGDPYLRLEMLAPPSEDGND
jgi:hypothetical protein